MNEYTTTAGEAEGQLTRRPAGRRGGPGKAIRMQRPSCRPGRPRIPPRRPLYFPFSATAANESKTGPRDLSGVIQPSRKKKIVQTIFPRATGNKQHTRARLYAIVDKSLYLATVMPRASSNARAISL